MRASCRSCVRVARITSTADKAARWLVSSGSDRREDRNSSAASRSSLQWLWSNETIARRASNLFRCTRERG